MTKRPSRSACIEALRRKFPRGLSTTEVIAEAEGVLGYTVSFPTFRKYVQLGMVLPSRRVALGSVAGSKGAYPPAAVIQLLETSREMRRRRKRKDGPFGPFPPEHLAQVASDHAREALEFAYEAHLVLAGRNRRRLADVRSAGKRARQATEEVLADLAWAAKKGGPEAVDLTSAVALEEPVAEAVNA